MSSLLALLEASLGRRIFDNRVAASPHWCACGHRTGAHDDGRGKCRGRRWANEKERLGGETGSLECDCEGFRDVGEVFASGAPVVIPRETIVDGATIVEPVGPRPSLDAGDVVTITVKRR